MIPSRARLAFLLRRWFWNQPHTTRRVLCAIPHWLFGIAAGIGLGYLAAQGF